MRSIARGIMLETEEASFAEFFRREYETLFRAIYLVSGDRSEAEDLAQGAFVKAWERWARVSAMQNPTGYLYTTALNARRSYLKRASMSARRALSIHEDDPVSQTDDRDRIRRALAMLPAGQREAIVLVEWLGLSDVEAGRTLGISAGAVRVRVSRAKTALRPLIEGATA